MDSRQVAARILAKYFVHNYINDDLATVINKKYVKLDLMAEDATGMILLLFRKFVTHPAAKLDMTNLDHLLECQCHKVDEELDEKIFMQLDESKLHQVFIRRDFDIDNFVKRITLTIQFLRGELKMKQK